MHSLVKITCLKKRLFITTPTYCIWKRNNKYALLLWRILISVVCSNEHRGWASIDENLSFKHFWAWNKRKYFSPGLGTCSLLLNGSFDPNINSLCLNGSLPTILGYAWRILWITSAPPSYLFRTWSRTSS